MWLFSLKTSVLHVNKIYTMWQVCFLLTIIIHCVMVAMLTWDGCDSLVTLCKIQWRHTALSMYYLESDTLIGRVTKTWLLSLPAGVSVTHSQLGPACHLLKETTTKTFWNAIHKAFVHYHCFLLFTPGCGLCHSSHPRFGLVSVL